MFIKVVNILKYCHPFNRLWSYFGIACHIAKPNMVVLSAVSYPLVPWYITLHVEITEIP